MDAGYSTLVEKWRAAASATMAAQRRLDAAFENFVAGIGPVPDQSLLDDLGRLQRLEHDLLVRSIERARDRPSE